MITFLTRQYLAQPGTAILPVAGATILAALAIVPGPGNDGIVVSIVALLLILGWPAIPQRTSELEIALPIRGRDLVLSRVFATLVVVLAPVAVWLAAMAIGHRLHSALGSPVPDVAALAALAVVLPHAWARGAPRPPRSYPTLLWVTLAAAGGAANSFFGPVAAGWVFVVAAVVSLFIIWSATPDAIQREGAASLHAPDVPAAAPARAPSSAPAPTKFRRAWWGVARVSVPSIALVAYVVVLAAGVMGGSLIAYVLAVALTGGIIRRRTRWLATLPLSHRSRLLIIVGPAVLLMAASATIGQRLGFMLPPSFQQPGRTAHYTIVTGSFLLTVGLLLLLVNELDVMRAMPRRRSRARRVAEWAVTAGIAWLILDAGISWGALDSWLARGSWPPGIAAALPASPLLALLVAALPVVAAYALLEWAFRRGEPALVPHTAGRESGSS